MNCRSLFSLYTEIHRNKKMKAQLFLLVSFLGATCCTAQSLDQCPSEWFDVSWSLIVDTPVQSNRSFLDPTLEYYREVLNYDDEQIESTVEAAIAFFNERFGLDFSQSEPNEAGIRSYQNAILIPYRIPADIDVVFSANRWLVNGVRGSNRCFYVLEGGFQVRFTGNQTVRGTYGGQDGRTLTPAADVVYVLQRVDVCRQSPLILQCQSITPSFTDLDGVSALYGECSSQFLGRGLYQGGRAYLQTDDPGVIRTVIRSVYTFPVL